MAKVLDSLDFGQLYTRLCHEWRQLLRKRSDAEGAELERLNKIYNAVLPCFNQIETARCADSPDALDLTATALAYFKEGG